MQIRMTGPNDFVVVDWSGEAVEIVDDEDEAYDPYSGGNIPVSFNRRSQVSEPVRSAPSPETGIQYQAPDRRLTGRSIMENAQRTAQDVRRGYVPERLPEPEQPYPVPGIMQQPTVARMPEDINNPYAAPAPSDWRDYLKPWRRSW